MLSQVIVEVELICLTEGMENHARLLQVFLGESIICPRNETGIVVKVIPVVRAEHVEIIAGSHIVVRSRFRLDKLWARYQMNMGGRFNSIVLGNAIVS